MADFFISYTHRDVEWAEWIGYVLEEEGFSVIIQAWDFRPGSNFVLEMQRAASVATRTILVLSPDYLKSQFASPEWAAAFAQDPQGLEQKVVPVMVKPCEPKGLLPQIVQIRVVGCSEDVARERLLSGVAQKRAKPARRPAFPGAAPAMVPREFPGSTPTAARPASSSPLIPPLNQKPTDIDRRRFIKQGFATIKDVFERNLQQVARDEARIETDFQPTTATDFRAELFIDGQSKCACRIWQGGMHSENNICYAEGRATFGNGCNEIISLSDRGPLSFQALMASSSFQSKPELDPDNLTAEQAAEYLWSRFVERLTWSR